MIALYGAFSGADQVGIGKRSVPTLSIPQNRGYNAAFTLQCPLPDASGWQVPGRGAPVGAQACGPHCPSPDTLVSIRCRG